jgi:two-component system, chemotaxis family, protein-glutamate methylesterase/glutaminase
MLVAIGASWGGLYALMELLGSLPADFHAPVVVVQHRGHDSDDTRLAHVLGRHTTLPVADAEDKGRIAPTRIYLAPADYHLIVTREHFELTLDEAVHYSRPSIDVLFESVADAFGDKAVAVLLTGYGKDGAAGLARVRDAGGMTIVQEPKSALQPAMPQAGIDAGGAVEVLSLEAIGPRLVELCKVAA